MNQEFTDEQFNYLITESLKSIYKTVNDKRAAQNLEPKKIPTIDPSVIKNKILIKKKQLSKKAIFEEVSELIKNRLEG